MFAFRQLQYSVIHLAVLIALFVLFTGCFSKSEIPDEKATPGASVEVDNRDWPDVTIYIIKNGTKYRLGEVSGYSRRVFPIEPHFLNAPTLQFQADPVGSTAQPISQEIEVRPGEEVVLTIMNFR